MRWWRLCAEVAHPSHTCHEGQRSDGVSLAGNQLTSLIFTNCKHFQSSILILSNCNVFDPSS